MAKEAVAARLADRIAQALAGEALV
jgi:hypothetical protein